MALIEPIGVPFDGYGRPGNQSLAAAALRSAGLDAAFPGHELVAGSDIDLPRPTPERADGSGLINEPALLAMTEALRTRVRAAIIGGRFPFVYGADCTVLLGAIAGLRDVRDEAGLVFIDQHEDTMPLDVSEDGEAANMEVGLLLGMTGQTGEMVAPEPLRRLPLLKKEALAMLGQRDQAWRRQFDVGSLRNRDVWLRTLDEVASDPVASGRAAVTHVMQADDGWWLHIDLDVLDPDEFFS